MSATGHAGSVFEAIDLAAAGLGAGSRELMAAAAVMGPRGIARDLLLEAGGLADDMSGAEALAELEERFFLRSEVGGRFSVHELVRAFTRTRTAEGGWPSRLGTAIRILWRRLDAAVQEGRWLDAQHDVVHARATADHALAVDDSFVRELLPPLLEALAVYARETGEFEEAAARVEQGLALASETHEGDSLYGARLLCMLAEAEIFRGPDRDRQALSLARRARRMAARVLPPRDPGLIPYDLALGFVLRVRREFRRALPFLQRALETAESTWGPDDLHTATSLSYLAAWHKEQGRLEEALSCYSRILDITRARLGPDRAELAIRLNHVGSTLTSMGRPAEALSYHEEALAVNERLIGERHQDTAMTCVFLGEALSELGRRDEAAAQGRRATVILESIPGRSRRLLDRARRLCS
jgi:tetratricopeptide (TPR) repeat protein